MAKLLGIKMPYWFFMPLLWSMKRLLSLNCYNHQVLMFSHLVLLFICIQMNLKGKGFFFGLAPDNVISLCKLCHVNKRLETKEIFFFLKKWSQFGEPQKVLGRRRVQFLPNNLHIPNELGLNSIRMALKVHYFLLYKLGLKA